MNNIVMAQAVQKACKPKFRGHNILKSKVTPHYPETVEREYMRVTNAYMALFNQILKSHLPTIRRAIDTARQEANTRRDADDFDSVSDVISEVFAQIQAEFERRSRAFGLATRLETVSNQMRRRTIHEWRRVVRQTLGLNITQDYYMGEFFRGALTQWTTNNVGLIKSIPETTLTNMQNIVLEGWQNGTTNTRIGKKVQEAYGISRRRAHFIARDQVSKLNANLAQAQQQDAGVQEYIWSDSSDVRVRKSHAKMQGKRCRWDDPTVYWNPTLKAWVPRTDEMVHKHPGEDYQCRCVALPIFNLPGLNLPWAGEMAA